jgi:sugar/nucleoside kinase (ribokinase family)
MSPDPPSQPLDLLVVGALTVDRFTDGSSAPGGSVLHIARVSDARGLRLGVITTAGREPDARAGLAELRRLAAVVEVAEHPTSWTFRHAEAESGRRLWIERAGGNVSPASVAAAATRAEALLFAPVAGEIDPAVMPAGAHRGSFGAILQGWLRPPRQGTELRPMPLAALPASLRAALGSAGMLVASAEDLAATAAMPEDQLAALRAWCGPGPRLVVTVAERGIWLDDPAGDQDGDRIHLSAPRVVDSPGAVGAGDILAAFLTLGIRASGAAAVEVAQDAMRVVAEALEARNQG